VQQCDSGERHDVDWATYDATMSVRGPDDGVDIHGGGLLQPRRRRAGDL